VWEDVTVGEATGSEIPVIQLPFPEKAKYTGKNAELEEMADALHSQSEMAGARLEFSHPEKFREQFPYCREIEEDIEGYIKDAPIPPVLLESSRPFEFEGVLELSS